MKADTGVSVEGLSAEIEGNKCTSHRDLPPVSVGGSIDVDCNGDGKDDYVLVNGRDVAMDCCESVSDPRESWEGSGTNGNVDDLSEVSNGDPVVDDPFERVGDKEVGSSELSIDALEKVEGGHVVVNGDHHSEAVNGVGDALNSEVKIDDLKNENGVVVDAESNGKVEDGDLLRENGEINLHGEATVENGKSRIENDGITQVEGEVYVKESESEVVEENCSKPLTNGFSHGESCILNGSDCNSLVNDTATTVVSDGDKAGNMLEPCATSSSNNEVQSEIPCELTEDQINGPESPISEAEECQIAEDNVQSHVADVVGDVEALDCKHDSIHEEVLEMQPSQSDSEDTHLPDSSVPEASDVEVKESLVDDAMSVNQRSDYQQPECKLHNGECKEHGGVKVEANYQQPELKPANGESEELGGVEADATFRQPELKQVNGEFEELGVDADGTVTEQGELELPEVIGNQEPSSNNCVAAISEVPETAEVVEVKGQAVMSLIAVLEGTDNENGAGSASAGMQRVVCAGVGDDDIRNNELPEEVDESLENSMENAQSDTTDKPSIDSDMERVDVNGTLEFVAEEPGDHKCPDEDNITMDQVAEDSGSVDVQNKEVVLEEVGLERNVKVEEETSQSNLQAANNAAMYNLGATGNDLCGVETPVNKVSSDVVHSQTVSVSGEGSDAADGDSSRPVDSAVCLFDSSKKDSITEQEQGCSVDDNTSSWNNVDRSAPSLHLHVPDAKLQKTSGSDVDVVNRSNGMSNNVRKPTISFGSFECEALFPYVNVNAQPEVLNRSVVLTSSKSKVEPSDGPSLLTTEGNGIDLTEFGPGKASEDCSVECANNSDGNPLSTSKANGVHLTELGPGKASEDLSMEHASNSDSAPLLTSEANEVHLTEFGLGKASEDWSVEHVSNNKLSTLPVKVSGPDVMNRQSLSTEAVRRPFHYLIRIPRYDDENLTKEISLHESKVDEKTQTRKSFQDECRKAKEISDELRSGFEAAIAEERAAWELLRAKQNEVKSAKSLIKLARNAVTVEDVQNQILNMEHKIEHETLNLNEEKQLIREIKQMKILKSQLNANRQNQEKVLQALDQSVEVEERLKVLKKELEPLQDKHARAKQRCDIAKKKLDEQKLLQNELFNKLRSADSVQQKAYEDRKTLKQQWFDKNKIFYKYKDDAKAANALAVAGDKDRLEQHCVNQVEKIMELWNKNDEFRKEYTRCNKRNTLRRFGTLDGRSLGPNEEPPSIPTVSYNRGTSLAKVNPVVVTVSSTEIALPREIKESGHNSSKIVVEQKNKTTLDKKMAKVAPKNSSAETSGRTEIIEKEKEIEEVKLTKEEIELEKNAEQQRKEEAAARLREQKRLEEIAKAKEALERKKRMAEKAQARAEFRARKEAEEKEKVREKRAKKKGKKRESTSEIVEIEPAVLAESASDTSREPEATEKPASMVKRSTKALPYTKQMKVTKSVLAPPPPVRNRGRNKFKPWWLVILSAMCVLALFFMGDSDVFRYLSAGFGLTS